MEWILDYIDTITRNPFAGGIDLTDATVLLNRQYAQLRSQHTDILYEDPKAAALYQRFHRKTMKASQREINTHLENCSRILIT